MTIKEIRKKSTLTQREFAKQVGVSLESVRDWEQGYSNPNLKSQEKINLFINKG